MGWRTKAEIPTTLAAAAFALQDEGRPHGPGPNRAGWHLVQLEERRMRTVPCVRRAQGPHHPHPRARQGAGACARPAQQGQGRLSRSRPEAEGGRRHPSHAGAAPDVSHRRCRRRRRARAAGTGRACHRHLLRRQGQPLAARRLAHEALRRWRADRAAVREAPRRIRRFPASSREHSCSRHPARQDPQPRGDHVRPHAGRAAP